MASNLLALAGNFLQAFTQSRGVKQEKEKDDKQNKLILKLMEEQLKDATTKREALELITRRMGGEADPIPQYSDAPGGLGLEKTGEIAGPTGGPGMSLTELLANAQEDPKITRALLRSGALPQIRDEAAEQQAAQAKAKFFGMLQQSGLSIDQAFKDPAIQAAGLQAGITPQQLMAGANAGGTGSEAKPTANIQDFMFSKENPDFLPFLQNRSELTAGGTGMGKAFSGAYEQIQTSGLQAGRTLNMYSRMLELNDMIETGKLAPAKTLVAELAQSFGVDVEGLDATQAFRALANRVALELRNPAGGAGMPGAMSEKDREFLIQSVPGLTLTSEGNKLIAQYAMKMAERDKQVFARARAFVRDNGALNEMFFDELEAWSDANPLFNASDIEKASGAAAPAGQPAANGGWSIVK